MLDPRFLRSRRVLAGLTQPQMAERLRISQQALSNYERGARKIPPKLRQRFARAYGVAVENLVA